ncbi:60S ribosomal protein L27, mitochondrial [Oleoguttula sp. CCFEE 5521]
MHPTPPLARAIRRLALTTKQAGKDYYKGTGTGSMGSHTKDGKYRLDYHKIRTYKVPEGLHQFTLTPFVTMKIEKRRDSFAETATNSATDGEAYLAKWKEEGGPRWE